jgi:hypothetical protein
MRKFNTLLALSIFIISTNYAQTLSGTITDRTSKEELIGVNIILENGGGTATDAF